MITEVLTMISQILAHRRINNHTNNDAAEAPTLDLYYESTLYLFPLVDHQFPTPPRQEEVVMQVQ